MPDLSNRFTPDDHPDAAHTPQHPNPASTVIYRQVRPEEIEAATTLLVTGRHPPSRDQVRAFSAYAEQRGVHPAEILVAVDATILRWALLPTVNPGRTALILSPSIEPAPDLAVDIRALIALACKNLTDRGVRLAQLLIDPAMPQIISVYQSCQFETLAELIYMRRAVAPAEKPPIPPDVELVEYSPAVHREAIAALAASYENSLDCPALNGRRQLEDVLAGHRGAGEFNPRWWTLLRLHNQPAGLLFLSVPTAASVAELVYLGLAPSARGKGLGDLLMRLALQSVAHFGATELTLAVDASNVPALALYHRFGMRRITSRLALMRDLSRQPAR